jgi:hypothetical protein
MVAATNASTMLGLSSALDRTPEAAAADVDPGAELSFAGGGVDSVGGGDVLDGNPQRFEECDLVR